MNQLLLNAGIIQSPLPLIYNKFAITVGMALERAGVESETGPVLVTGASGGVGSIALILLSHLGYRAVAVTGRPSEQDYLRKLGAAEIIDRQSFAETGRPLEKAIWAGAIDVAGGPLLASICAAIQPRGAVAACLRTLRGT